jgi:hypothetical protein
MDIEQNVEQEAENRPKNPIVWTIWNIMFALFYPILAAFSLVIMVVMFFFSTLSSIIIRIASLFKRS